MADAEAATARLVAQMTESSPRQDHGPLQLVTAHIAGGVRSAHVTKAGRQQQQQRQHSSDWENVPQVQQHAGKRRGIAQSGHAAADVEAGGKEQQAKRHKVFKDTAPVHPPAAEEGVSGKDDGPPLDAKEIIGRAVQQQFEAGIFKVGVCLVNSQISFSMQAYTGQGTHTGCTALTMLACTWLSCIPTGSL